MNASTLDGSFVVMDLFGDPLTKCHVQHGRKHDRTARGWKKSWRHWGDFGTSEVNCYFPNFDSPSDCCYKKAGYKGQHGNIVYHILHSDEAEWSFVLENVASFHVVTIYFKP